MSIKWKTRNDMIKEYYIALQSTRELNTGYKFIDKNINSPSIISISARPSVGKSLLIDQIGHSFINNGFRWLAFQLEMIPYETVQRELIYNNIKFNEKEDYFRNSLNKPIDVIENVSINNLYNTLLSYKNTYPNDDILVTIDHLFLIGGCDNGKNLQPIFSELVKFKKMGMYFIILSHLKRDVYLSDRCKQGHINNYIFENDVYMSDVIIQYSDLSLAMDIPSRRGISLYGPNKIQVGINDIMMLTLKNRKGNRKLYHYTRLDNLTYSHIATYDDDGNITVSINMNNVDINTDLF